MVYFNDSLDVFAEIIANHGIVLDKETVLMRDGVGRLFCVIKKIAKEREVEAILREKLGNYVAPVAFVTGSLGKRLISDPVVRPIIRTIGGEPVEFMYGDRRIVGSDWTQIPHQAEKRQMRLVFGSLKGGVGRSTALAVLAAELARRGVKVLAVDLDLEAPGIGSMLLPRAEEPAEDRRPKYGVIDYLVENGINGVMEEDLYDFIGVSPFHEGSIDVLPATGRETDRNPELMISKLSRALMEDRGEKGPISLSQQIRGMLEVFEKRGRYDVTLIDARAGIAEITAAPLLGLGAEVLFFGVDQPQTFQGYRYILAQLSLLGFGKGDAWSDWRSRLNFVQSKASASSKKREEFRESLYDLCSMFLYDAESIGDELPSIDLFSPSPNEMGPGVPHDATYIEYHHDFDAFDPLRDVTQLDYEVYNGPFGSFIKRAIALVDPDGKLAS